MECVTRLLQTFLYLLQVWKSEAFPVPNNSTVPSKLLSYRSLNVSSSLLLTTLMSTTSKPSPMTTTVKAVEFSPPSPSIELQSTSSYEPWNSPCKTESTVEGKEIPPEFLALFGTTSSYSLYENISILLKEGATLASNLKEQIFKVHLQSSIAIADALDTITVFWNPSYGLHVRSNDTQLSKPTDIVPGDFQLLREVYIFLDQCRSDEARSDGQNNDSLEAEYDRVAEKLLTTLCNMDELLKALHTDTPSPVERSVMPTNLRVWMPNEAERYKRHYVIVKDVISVLQTIVPFYDTMMYSALL